VFFRQIRTGRGGEPFAILKFRTMYEDAESRRQELAHLNQVDGPLFKMHDDPRVTPVGRLLRRRSLDELAQLFNVWKGDMSLVGPRPFVVAEAEEIKGWAARKRFEVRPGMTGLWQVSGRNAVAWTRSSEYRPCWESWAARRRYSPSSEKRIRLPRCTQ
jgi:lipopolysaccharide/colanic/teichoic acid biosynthesis glycosyltransferase